MSHVRTRSTIGSLLIAIAALLALSAGSVAADTAPGRDGTFTQNGTSADVFTSTCSPNGDDTTTCSEQGLSVFTGKMTDSVSGARHRNQVCVYASTYTYDDVTGDPSGDPVFESGCSVDLPAGTVSVGKSLSSVRLATTTVDVHEFVCDEVACEPGPGREVTVAGTWTGVGPTITSKYRSTFDDGTCRFDESGKVSNRSASFAGAIDGDGLGADVQASIASGRFSYRSRCIES
jgi:hypothetical protein